MWGDVTNNHVQKEKVARVEKEIEDDPFACELLPAYQRENKAEVKTLEQENVVRCQLLCIHKLRVCLHAFPQKKPMSELRCQPLSAQFIKSGTVDHHGKDGLN